MIFKIANISNALELAKLHWYFQENNTKYNKSFINKCTDFIKKGIKNKTWNIMIALDKKRIVSHIFINKINKLPKPNALFNHFGYITNVYTLPEYRNKGIGSKLMKYVIKWAKSNKYELLVVWRSKNSKKYYENNGYKINNEIMEQSNE